MNQFKFTTSGIGFIGVGFLTVLVNLICFQFAIYLGFSIYISTLLGNFVSILVNYLGLSSVFSAAKTSSSIFAYLITWFTYYFLTVGIVMLFISINLSPLESRVASLMILTPINYLVQKYLVFRSN
jgi:putative flippase GtrA